MFNPVSQIADEVICENMLEVASMLHGTFLGKVEMPIDENLLRRFGPVISEEVLAVRVLFIPSSFNFRG